MSFDLERGPLHYDFLSFLDPHALEKFKEGIDPDNKLRKVQVEFNDPKIRNFYWRHIFKDLEASTNSEMLYKNLVTSYQQLKRTGMFKQIGISFEPVDEETYKVILTPEHKKRTSFGFTDGHFGYFSDSFGFYGTFMVKNVTGMMDSISLNTIQGYYGNLKDSYFLSYMVPSVYKNYTLRASLGIENSMLNGTVQERSKCQLIRLQTNKTSFQISNTYRTNWIDPICHSKEVLDQELIPSQKLAFVAEHGWKKFSPNKDWGIVTKVKGELSSVENSGKFLRLEVNNASIAAPQFIRQKGRISQLTFENFSSVGVLMPLWRAKARINDRFYKNSMKGFKDISNPEFLYDKTLNPLAGNPGFEHAGDYLGDDLYFRNTFKIMFNQCPILKNRNIIPFVYGSYGYFSGATMDKWLKPNPAGTATGQKRYMDLMNEVKKKSRGSVGLGVQTTVKNLFNMEALINLHAFGTVNDKFTTFQFRCSVND